jgi:hypothetical protein
MGLPPPLRFESATLLAQQQVRLVLSGAAGSTFTIRSSSNLVNWVALANLTNTTGTLEFTDSSPTNTLRRFYRATSP